MFSLRGDCSATVPTLPLVSCNWCYRVIPGVTLSNWNEIVFLVCPETLTAIFFRLGAKPLLLSTMPYLLWIFSLTSLFLHFDMVHVILVLYAFLVYLIPIYSSLQHKCCEVNSLLSGLFLVNFVQYFIFKAYERT